jgi:hypothetical protein
MYTYQQFDVARSLWITYIIARVCINATECNTNNNINGCELVLEETHYNIYFVS